MGKVISNPFANAFVNEAEGEDHEVSMGQNQLDTIIKMATELKAKMGENEKEIPAWIQDHISKAENYISQAAGNYHEYGTNEASVPTGERIQNLNNRIKALRDKLSATKSPEQKKLFQDRLKNALQTLSNIKKDYSIKKESVNEDSPCWKGYKQVGMKDKNGRQVPNCVPNESVVREISSRTPKIFVKTAAVEKKIKELMADRKKAVVPYNNETDPAKKEKLKQILIKLTNQIKGYENNLVKLRDMEEEYLQQMHADAELDTTGL
jgi:flagellar biosynthesis chaperone FliJ